MMRGCSSGQSDRSGSRGERVEAHLDRATSHARASGAADRLIVTLESTTVQGFLAGNFTISAEANEGLQLAVETGLDNAASLYRACLGWLAMVRGDQAECQQYVADALEVSIPAATASPTRLPSGTGLARPRLRSSRTRPPTGCSGWRVWSWGWDMTSTC